MNREVSAVASRNSVHDFVSSSKRKAEFFALLTQPRSFPDFQWKFRVLFSSGQGDPWLGHFFLDARTCRVILRFRRFLLRHGVTLPPRRRSFYSLLHSVTEPALVPPQTLLRPGWQLFLLFPCIQAGIGFA